MEPDASPDWARALILPAFVASVLVAAALVGGSYWLSVQQARTQAWISHTQEVRAALAATRADVVQVQGSVRGFIVSGRESDLAPYASARQALAEDIARLRVLTAGDPVQQQELRRLEEVLQPRLTTAAAVIDARRSGGFEAGRALMDRDGVRSEIARVQSVLERMSTEEGRLLAVRMTEHSERLHAFWTAMGLLPVGLVAALALLYVQLRRKRQLEQVLMHTEQQFRRMMDSTTEYAIVMLDARGRVATWNPGAERIKGYAPPEILGRHFRCFYPIEDRLAAAPERALRQAASDGRFTIDGWRVRKDGTEFWASVVISAVHDSAGRVTGYCKIVRDLTDRKAAEELLQAEIRERVRMDEQLQRMNARLEELVDARTRELQQANAGLNAANTRLQDLSARLLSAQEEERHRLARELHDETGQALTLIRLQLASAAAAPAGATQKELSECDRSVERAITHLRGLALRLRPPMLDDVGLVDAIDWLLQQHAGAAGWQCTVDAPELGRLPESTETACFRICQEALTNAARHAQANELRVTLRVLPEFLELAVEDDGVGFEQERYRSAEERKKHFGLLSMTERAVLTGGQLEIESEPGRGTRVHALLPLGSEYARELAEGLHAVS